LAFTVFREDFSPTFVAMFTMLLFFKCFHWLADDRVDYVSSPIASLRALLISKPVDPGTYHSNKTQAQDVH